MGTITAGMTGTGFLYTNQESISVGIGCIVSDFAESEITPYGLLEAFKAHPSIKPLLENSECKEYAAHLIPEGGYKAMPELCGDGWIVVGDAGQFVNAVHREGSNLAMTTGRIAGELVADLKARKAACSKAELARIQAAPRRHVRNEGLEEIPRNSRISCMATNRSSGSIRGCSMRRPATGSASMASTSGPRKRKSSTSFRKGRTLPGLINDGLKLARAWR